MIDERITYTTEELKTALDIGEELYHTMRREGMPSIKRGHKRWWSGRLVIAWLISKHGTTAAKEVQKEFYPESQVE